MYASYIIKIVTSSVCVRSWINKLYDFVNCRLQNLQINCFFGRLARPGARNSLRSRPGCIPGPHPGGYKLTPGGKVNALGPVGDWPGPVRNGDEYTPALPGGGIPERGSNIAAAAASRSASSLRLSAIIAINSKPELRLVGISLPSPSGSSIPGNRPGLMERDGSTGTKAELSRCDILQCDEWVCVGDVCAKAGEYV